MMCKSDYKFQKLTPTDSVELSVYENAINFIFENSDIKNVAISGSYGAGKSSILASYKEKHKDLNFIHISLAHFQTEQSNNDDFQEKDYKPKESVLEGKILNQLIHQISSDKIPQTNFRIKKFVNNKVILNNTYYIITEFFIVLYIVFFNNWKVFFESLPETYFKDLLMISVHPNVRLIIGIILAGLVYKSIYDLVKIQMNKNIFKHFKFQGNEIEIFEESEDSYFDKYLNEVLYIFKNCDADVIVFEDIDRFEMSHIFERLHEINTLVNINSTNNKVLRFFYLLRDDIFIYKDRTKFFDYIIPIVPVIDGTNSYNKFIIHFKENNLFDKFDQRFLQGLSLYVDDMRLLKNICNEFLIYYNLLKNIELDYNKMLAIITYKNLFPRDFSELQVNQGFVYSIFSNKNNFINDEIRNLNNQIQAKRDEINNINNEELKSLEELEYMYKGMKESKSEIPYYNERNNYQIKIDNWYKNEYPKRKENIKNKCKNNLSKLEDEISALENKLLLIKSQPLHNIITRENIDKIFSLTSKNEIGEVREYNEIKANEYFDILKYLIRNGYIDETYADYMTYFYEESISLIDKIFLRSITDNKPKEYTYKLKNPSLVLSYLKPLDFDQIEILNFDLFTYMLQTDPESEDVIRFIAQLKNSKNFKFTREYFECTTIMEKYIKILNLQWPSYFREVLDNKELSTQQIRDYSIYTLYYSSEDEIKAINIENCLSKYISEAKDYLEIDNPNMDIIDKFIFLDVKFANIDYSVSNKDLFWGIYENSLYIMNFDNIQLMLQEAYNIEPCEGFTYKNYNYTLIASNKNSPLFKLIMENISTYMDIILAINNKNYIYDKEFAVIDLLNNENISLKQKNNYINLLSTKISSIKSINDTSLWSILLDHENINYSEENIIDYYDQHNCIDNSLRNFINSGRKKLDFRKINIEDDIKSSLFNECIICTDIDDEKYIQIITSLELYYEYFSIDGISKERMKILIDNNIIGMNIETLKYIRKNYSNVSIYFIKKHIAEYIEIIDKETFSHSELIEILASDVDDKIKIKLITYDDSAITIVNKNYSTDIIAYILEHNLKPKDMEYLYEKYDSIKSKIKTIVLDYATSHISDVIDFQKCSLTLVKLLLGNLSIDVNDRVDLFVSKITNMSKDFAKECLDITGLSNYTKIFDSSTRPKFEINDQSEKILNAFKENGWIYEFYEDSNKSGSYSIRRRKPKKIKFG